jgi:hypothetical protein
MTQEEYSKLLEIRQMPSHIAEHIAKQLEHDRHKLLASEPRTFSRYDYPKEKGKTYTALESQQAFNSDLRSGSDHGSNCTDSV